MHAIKAAKNVPLCARESQFASSARIQFTIRYIPVAASQKSLFRIQSAASAPFSSFSINKAPTFSARKRILILNSHAILWAQSCVRHQRFPSVHHYARTQHNRVHICRAAYDSLFHGMNLFCCKYIHNISSRSVEFHYASSTNRVIHQRHDSGIVIQWYENLSRGRVQKRMNGEYTFQHKNVHAMCIIDYIVMDQNAA
jgi:hypothetical protein